MGLVQATAAGEAMAGQAQGMTQLMEFFTVDASFASGSMAMDAPVAAAPSQAAAPTATQAPSAPAADQGGLSVSNSHDDWEEF